ncbi:hypothetical protein RintRC_3538 [Richelia intracellularis]|nr:hypothetical protein RintRC_3538 [Richelia intracellularis]
MVGFSLWRDDYIGLAEKVQWGAMNNLVKNYYSNLDKKGVVDMH